MNDDMADMEIEDTRSRRGKVVEDRLRHLHRELEVNARLNTGLARAAGMTASDVPDQLLQEIRDVDARAGDVGPLTRADLADQVRGEPSQADSRWDPEKDGWEPDPGPPRERTG